MSAKELGWGVVIEVTKYFIINPHVPIVGNMGNSTTNISKIYYSVMHFPKENSKAHSECLQQWPKETLNVYCHK